MIHARLLTALLLVSVVALAASARAGKSAFAERTITDGASSYRYKVFVPANWTAKKKWPVILFLHGAGERGDDNLAQTRIGIGPALEQQNATLKAVVVLPQCPRDRWWPEPEMQARALRALDEAAREFNGDASRIYLTGLSMGGYGAWAIAASNPKRFAALAVVCGGVRTPPRAGARSSPLEVAGGDDPYRTTAEKIGKLPIWVFHGGADPVVPVTESQKMVEAFKSLGVSARYTEYAGVGHNSWDKAYAEAELFPWMLSQRLRRIRR